VLGRIDDGCAGSSVEVRYFCPFTLPRAKYQSGAKIGKFKKRIDQSSARRKKFWQSIEERYPGLATAVGCYVFALGRVPWYVGKTEKLRFEMEAWQPHKIDHYETALATRKRAEPVLYLIAKRTPAGRFSKASSWGHRDVRLLEGLMIGAALRRNEELLNKRDTKYLRAIHVPGFMNVVGRGRWHKPASSLARLFAAN